MATVYRNPLIDQVKGLLILGVIYIHGAYLAGDAGFLQGATCALSRLSVPYFFILFCLFLERKTHDSSQAYVERFRALFLPYVFWSIIYFIINVDFDVISNSPYKLLTGYWWGRGWAGQYFFIVCFQLIILFPLVKIILVSGFEWAVFVLAGFFIILSYNGLLGGR